MERSSLPKKCKDFVKDVLFVYPCLLFPESFRASIRRPSFCCSKSSGEAIFPALSNCLIEKEFRTHRVNVENAPCRDARLGVQRWQSQRAAFGNSVCCVSRFGTLDFIVSLRLSRLFLFDVVSRSVPRPAFCRDFSIHAFARKSKS